MSKAICPRCGREFEYDSIKDMPTFPFCRERCRLIDLGNWFEERYRIHEPVDEEYGDTLDKGNDN